VNTKTFANLLLITLCLIYGTYYIYSVYNKNDYIYNKNEITIYEASTTLPNEDRKEEVKEKSISILFVGDIMLDRNVARRIRKNGFDTIFKDIHQIFKNKDIVVGNLEGNITNNPSISEVDHNILRFTFNKEYATKLKDIGFTIFSLANNHSMDFYKAGYDETISNLSNANLKYFGSAYNNENISESIEVNNNKICFIGYHDLYTFNENPILDEIKNTRDSCNYQIIFAHWGNEYKNYASERQIELAHKFIDTGADLVIGAHPHVIQPIEIYRNKAIFYSLGNFVFDQDFSYETKHSFAVELNIDSKEQRFNIIPLSSEYTVLSISNETDTNKTLNILGKEKEFILNR
jgi:poly-gamma-glutamate synthesis protein (capsule biosynthesis protein)